MVFCSFDEIIVLDDVTVRYEQSMALQSAAGEKKLKYRALDESQTGQSRGEHRPSWKDAGSASRSPQRLRATPCDYGAEPQCAARTASWTNDSRQGGSFGEIGVLVAIDRRRIFLYAGIGVASAAGYTGYTGYTDIGTQRWVCRAVFKN